MSQSIVASNGYLITRQTMRSLYTSELHSESKKRKLRKFDHIIQKNLNDSVSKTTTPDAPDHVLYSDSVDLDSIQFTNDNVPVMSDRTAVLRNLSLIIGLSQNLIHLKGSFWEKRNLLVNLKKKKWNNGLMWP